MTWFADLDPCSYPPYQGFDRVLAVGWLDPEHPYSEGRLSPHELAQLAAAVKNSPWREIYKGDHRCQFCRGATCNGDVWIPGVDVVFVSPVMILHYVEVHQYAPPPEFISALTACPAMKSPGYREALKRAGGAAFAQRMGLADPVPCPYCGEPLISPRAKLCHRCLMDWHDPLHPRRLTKARSADSP
jgi:hypothetical protein